MAVSHPINLHVIIHPGTTPSFVVMSEPFAESSTNAPYHILIFTKHPKSGFAKTRLIPGVGADRAAEISAILTEHTLSTVRELYNDPHYQTFVHFSTPPDIAPSATQDWLQPTQRETLLPQTSGDLGERLIQAFAYSFAKRAERVVVIGTDAPALTSENIRTAFATLDNTDVVLGPASDGGYYLLALRAPAPTLFTNIPWSTSTVASTTRKAAEAAGLRVTELGVLHDVDTPDDLVHFPWLSHAVTDRARW